jgi:hypothetical protein
MNHELTPAALARVRRWVTLLETDPTAPDWSPAVSYATPQPLRRAALWLVHNGHAPGLRHELVCVLLALYALDATSDVDDASAGLFIPRDAA